MSGPVRGWRHVVRLIGGVYEIGRLDIIVHDDGVIVAWDQISRWEWPAPATPAEGGGR